ncbi:hypothetical protein BJ170DRAFT_298673 [Xylariales sp. AK1849]|nr:hypothetical protein BJ170DRAFT_298673 [Xylariales sp. AK1849]
MLSKRLEELSQDPGNPNGIAELVVTALGTQGSFYISWKTPSGRYEQDSHGLPSELEEWLFPSSGRRRDFPSLQVVLGPGDGEFYASDCNGKVGRKAPEAVIHPLRRASSLQPADSAIGSRRLSVMGMTKDAASRTRLRRSVTLSSIGWQSSLRTSSVASRLPAAAADIQQDDAPRKVASWPHTAARAGRPQRRPQSMYHPQPLVLSISENPGSSHGHQHQQSQGLDRHAHDDSCKPASSQAGGYPSEALGPAVRMNVYVDAGVQTETPRLPFPLVTNLDPVYCHKHVRDWSSTSTTSTVFTSSSSGTSTRRSSIAEDAVMNRGPQIPDKQVLFNPVMMGRMQDYFRSAGYRLGDALQP